MVANIVSHSISICCSLQVRGYRCCFKDLDGRCFNGGCEVNWTLYICFGIFSGRRFPRRIPNAVTSIMSVLRRKNLPRIFALRAASLLPNGGLLMVSITYWSAHWCSTMRLIFAPPGPSVTPRAFFRMVEFRWRRICGCPLDLVVDQQCWLTFYTLTTRDRDLWAKRQRELRCALTTNK